PGRRGELARLAAHPGVMVAVSTDTVLLAERVNRGNRRRRLLVDARHGMIGRLDDAALDVDAAARALACELVLRAVLDAGADAAVVQIGGYGLRSTPAPDLAAA
ncbi:MAG TPA: hypothetical protein VJT31_26710, partial [Rugosimonospora sp.]|nr:hypothetical protein [Rugosimonospora sp.]